MRKILTLCTAAFAFYAVGTTSSIAQTAKPETPSSTCKIQGIVMKTEQWISQKYKDTPGFFNEAYVRVTVRIQKNEPHQRYSNVEQPGCAMYKENQDAKFKLCHPNSPRLGDVITAVAGQPTGATEYGCLFDIQVLSNALDDQKGMSHSAPSGGQ